MGLYLNPGNRSFCEALNSEIYVDKTEMIRCVNRVIGTNQKYMCVSRPRRFGKTITARMLCAYYDRTANSRALFENCKIGRSIDPAEQDIPWDAHLGKYNVLRLVMTDFFSGSESVSDMLSCLNEEITSELIGQYPDISYGTRISLSAVMSRIYAHKGIAFVVIIDEWDAIFREYANDKEGQREYLNFLRDWMKDKEYIALAYMTGILPIKKYGKHSALNMFTEYSMLSPQQLAPYTGFTRSEVKDLCESFRMRYDVVSDWYDGYRIENQLPVEERDLGGDGMGRSVPIHIFSPLSVVNCMRFGRISNYWNATETYEALQQYIDWNFDGLKEDVAILMGGGRVEVDITGYQNDMTTFHSKDDILTMLIHLGYLGYDSAEKALFIPNREVLEVFRTSTKNNRSWTATFRALENSGKLLEATWACDEETVSELIEAAHDRAGNRTYHSEAGLSYAVQLAYYSAQDLYTIIPEMDTGKGYADLAFIPKTPDIPALLIELKYEETANTAIAQIHRQRYPDRLEHYKKNLILVGISYNKGGSNDNPTFKQHTCRIERA